MLIQKDIKNIYLWEYTQTDKLKFTYILYKLIC